MRATLLSRLKYALRQFGSARARFAADEQGATAVEFAIVATPFLAMLLAIIQTGLIFLSQEILQSATLQASRLIMTGTAQTQKLSSAQFQQNICNYASPLINCANVYLNVQVFSSFSTVAGANPISGGSISTAGLGYNPGNPGDIVLVQVFYEIPVVLGPLNFNLTNMSGNNRLIVATSVFRNEPY